MDQAAVITLTVTKEDRSYVFSMPHGANFGEAYDAAFAVLSEIVEMSKRAVDKVERKEVSTEPKTDAS